MPTITRRSLLRTAGAAGVLGALPIDKAFAEYFRPANALYPPESLVTCCGICDSACGIEPLFPMASYGSCKVSPKIFKAGVRCAQKGRLALP